MAQTYDIVIKGTGMGEGEKVLTDNLMNAFVHTVAQRENLPSHIIFWRRRKISYKRFRMLR